MKVLACWSPERRAGKGRVTFLLGLGGLVCVLLAAAHMAGAFLPSLPPVLPAEGAQIEAPLADLIASVAAEVRQAPKVAGRHGKLGLVYMANLMHAEARDSFRNAVVLDPGDPSWRYLLAVALHGAGEHGRAIDVLHALLELHPDHALAWHRLAVLLLEAERFPEAGQAAQRAVELAPQSAECLTVLGATQLDLGDASTALGTLDRALELDPVQPRAHQLRGRACVALGRTGESELEFALGDGSGWDFLPNPHAREMAGSMRSLLGSINVAERLLATGREELAVGVLEDARRARPADATVLRSLGTAYLASHRFERALATLENALVLAPDDAKTWSNKGECLGQLGRLDESLAAFDRALEIDPGAQKAHLGRARLLLPMGRTDEGLVAIEAAVAADPRAGLPRLFLGQTYLAAGRREDGLREVRAAGRADLASLETQLGVAETLLYVGDLDGAESGLALARRIDPRHPKISEIAGRIRAARSR